MLPTTIRIASNTWLVLAALAMGWLGGAVIWATREAWFAGDLNGFLITWAVFPIPALAALFVLVKVIGYAYSRSGYGELPKLEELSSAQLYPVGRRVLLVAFVVVAYLSLFMAGYVQSIFILVFFSSIA